MSETCVTYQVEVPDAIPQDAVVKVGPHSYRVRMMPGLHDTDGSMLWGHIRHGQLAIEVHPDLAPECQYTVLWHEILHALLSQAGFDNHNEQMLEVLAHGIAGVLADNVELRDPTLNRDLSIVDRLRDLPALLARNDVLQRLLRPGAL